MVDRHAPQRNGAHRALVVSAVNPYPTDAGKKVVLAGLLAHLADRLGPDNVHYGLVGRPEDAPGTFPVRLHPLRRPSTREQLRSVVTRVPTGRSSLQEALLRGQAVAAGVRAVVDEVDPDLVVLDTVRFAQYLPEVPARPGRRVVCYLDDLFSERYAGMLAARRRFADVRIEPLGPDFRRLIVSYGFMEAPNLPKALGLCRRLGLKFDIMATSFFLGRRSVVPSAQSGMPLWQDKVFIFLMRNAANPTDFYKIPPGRVVELGTQVTV